ncbi:Vesicle transport protein SFT2A [Amphibalanus amphitrite]|uniref:Vesicle transport protein n=2 Tax=Amphibalanus amphitrite TaxID=1232801 RepID=A0A6A4WH62_AMPAM|nr:vesicle transport protein SFT2B-like [Amphibalanus amphitrite]XP_043216126.1 vesicle transport protein SFT2B-like [Amphibalanus amphitrite]XP_043216127.1 vesicle transport protein SFT2B-like [Amphibalanus amphitrite]XP_043216128.1 vesicle transport protein SFT2B-like [Amphibalanus amphitrite]XP_043216129.1 vesicle transport protein SFT2B-like [Amphibalanus amphitrite]XP_043216130.1 vesicle transport protein SFT2B-like [Amphibalanus amphitrite]XP_043220034.1 vesicle transport protein SFT2B-
MDKLKRALTGRENDPEDEEAGFYTQVVGSTTLSWSTRLRGFIICFVTGIICSILGSVLFWFKNGIVIFCILYTIGNITAMSSTLFLMGPVKQLKNMFAKTRAIATVVVLLSIVLTIVAAALHKKGLVLIFCIIEFVAMTWYSISYIPFARDAVINTFKSCIG